MSAIETPATDARAEEWGAFAVSIPGWRSPRLPCMPYLLSPSQTSSVPDPDHWAWTGWLLLMLGPSISMTHRPDGTWWVGERRLSKRWWGDGITLGRACIAAAASVGRWPGGGE